MTVRELMTMLQDFHPDEEVAFFSLSNKYLQVLGINEEKTAAQGMLVFSVDWCVDRDKPRETPKEKLERQAKMIQDAIDKIDEEEMRKAVGKVRRKTKERRTAAQQLLDGYIPTGGKKGRPRKIVTEKDFEPKPKGRPRKYPRKEDDEEVSKDFSTMDKLLGL